MTCILIEDEQYWKSKILILLDELGITVIGVAETIAQADSLLKKSNPNFLIADITLKGEVVFELFKNNIQYCQIPTIFLTLSDKEIHYKQAHTLKKQLFIVKPVHKLTLKSAIENIAGLTKNNTDLPIAELIVKGRYNEDIRIPFSKIIYLSQNLKYCTIYTLQKNITLKKPLSEMIKNLNSEFIRIHNSYCINTNFIQSVGVGLQNIKLQHTTEILPIGVSFIPAIKDFLSKKNSDKY